MFGSNDNAHKHSNSVNLGFLVLVCPVRMSIRDKIPFLIHTSWVIHGCAIVGPNESAGIPDAAQI